MPAGAPSRAHMVEALATPSLQDVHGGSGNRPAGSRRPDLVIHDFELTLFARRLQNRQQEIPAARREDPAHPEDQVAAAGVLDGALAIELALAVGADRI